MAVEKEGLDGNSGSGIIDGDEKSPKIIIDDLSHSMPKMNESWFGKPVEEVDPLIFDDTFCVITKKMDRHYIYRFSCAKSLFLMGPLNPIRRLAIYVTTHRWFDLLIIFTILCNCVTLAMITNFYVAGTKDTKVVPETSYYIEKIEYGFLCIYTMELVLKVISKGLIGHKFSYLRNRWNILDLVVVTSGYVTIVKDLLSDSKEVNELDFLRTFRVLRVIKTISVMPGLKLMINALLSSVRHLAEVMALIVVCLMIFSLFAVEVFQGTLRQKCVIDKGGPMDPDRIVNQPLESVANVDERNRLWTEWVSDWKNWKRRDFPDDEPTQCGNDSGTRLCGLGYTCIGMLGDNPDDGWTSFDNFFASMLSTFQLITADYWERVYDIVVSSVGLWSVVFFVIIIFFGAYYLLNLLLAVVAMSYETEAQLQDLSWMTPAQRLGLYRGQSNFSFDELSKLNICKMTHYRKRTKSEQEKLARTAKYGSELPLEEKEGKHLDDAILNLLGMRIALQKDIEDAQPRPSNSSVSALRNANTDQASTNTLKVADERSRSESDVEVTMSKVAYPVQSTVVAAKGKISKFIKSKVLPIVAHRYFENFITFCILLNTVCLAMEHHGESKTFEDVLRFSSLIFMAVFTAECVLKLTALQGHYFKSGWNQFDLIILVISYVDLIIVSSNSSKSGLSVLRSMRLLRVFKLAQSWITMKVLLNIIFTSFADLGNLTILLMIIIYIFAVMGMQVIGEQYNPGAFDAIQNPLRFPRWNWKHFWYAFMMVFRVLCGEWIEPLWDCLHAQTYYINDKQASPYVSYLKCFSIYLPILIVGNFIVFNLFLAMLLNSFDTEELNAQRDKELEASGRTEKVKTIINLLMARKHKDDEDEEAELLEEETQANENDVKSTTDGNTLKPASLMNVNKVPSTHSIMSSRQGKHASTRVPESRARRRWRWAINRVLLYIRIDVAELAIARAENKWKRKHVQMSTRLFLKNPGAHGRSDNIQHDATPVTSESAEISVARDCLPAKLWKSKICCCRKRGIPNRRKSLGKESLYNKTRNWSVHIVGHKIFEYTILVLIFASSITLCFEDIYLDNNPELKKNLCICNFVFTGIFFVEMVLKWFAIGLWGYFTNFWTILDGFIVIISSVSIYFDLSYGTCFVRTTVVSGPSFARSHIGSLKALRTLRALRPLRAISRWQGMKIVVNALIHAIPAIFNVLLVCLLFWLIFAIMGVQFFKGQFYRCVDNEGENIDPRVAPTKEVCCAKADTHDYSWINTVSNYDNVFEGYLSLFQIATFEGWMELMSFSVDAVGVDRQPSVDYQIQYYAFYVIFIIVGSFFALELFTGVIIDNFNMLKKKYEGSVLEILLTPTQRSYYIAMKNLGKKKPKPLVQKPKSKIGAFFFFLALSKRLEVLIFVMIFLNMMVEGCETMDTKMWQLHVLGACKGFFTTIYVLEAAIKIIGLRFYYFTVPWNVYDFILVLASLMDVFLTSDLTVTMPIPPSMLRIVRVLRIGRILRSVKAAQGLRKLLFALTISLPALLNIGALLALITFIYAILGMTLFGRAPDKWSIDDVYSFKTFKSSNLMLLRLMTLAGWNEVLDSLTVVEPVCGSYRHIACGLPGEPECPNRALVVAYIVSYMLLTNQIMINLFIAIILENYVEASDEEDVGIIEDDLEMFYVRWSRYDPYATQFIDFANLSDFLDSLNPPLQVPKPNMLAIVTFDLPITRGNKMHCLDILHALIKQVLGQVDDTPEFRKLQHKMERKFKQQFPNREFMDIVSSTRQWKVENNAATVIQRAWRRHLAEKQLMDAPPAIEKVQTQESVKSSQVKSEGGEHGGLGHMMKRMGNVDKKDGAKSPDSGDPAAAAGTKKKKEKKTIKKLKENKA